MNLASSGGVATAGSFAHTALIATTFGGPSFVCAPSTTLRVVEGARET